MEATPIYPKRNLLAAARDGLVWLSGPVSERGASRGFRIAVHLGGPLLHKRRLAMRENPSGRSLLDERPDLCAVLNDMPALGAMPEGSLGRAYYDFMDHPETVPGYMLSGMIYKDGWFDTVAMDEELCWCFERWIQTHDLMHVVSGYGADLAGEGLNIYFTLAYNMGISWRAAFWTPFGLAPRLMQPSVGRNRWLEYLREAWQRGTAAREHLSFESVPWEALLPLALDGMWTGGDNYAYGLATYDVGGRTYIGHGGGNAGYRSALVVDLEAGLGVVFLLNRMGETDPVVDAAQHALTVVRDAHQGLALPAAPAFLDPRAIENAREYAGSYRSGDKTLRLKADGHELLLENTGEPIALERRAPDSFYVGHPDYDLFLLDFKREEGKVVEAFHGGDWYTRDRYSGARTFDVPEAWRAYPGHYRTRNPELSNFRIVLRKGELALIIGWGTTEPLVPVGDGVFRVGEDSCSPETLRFSAVVEGRALRADYSGCPYFRTFTR